MADTEQDKINRAVAEVRHNKIIEKLDKVIEALTNLITLLQKEKKNEN